MTIQLAVLDVLSLEDLELVSARLESLDLPAEDRAILRAELAAQQANESRRREGVPA